MYKKFLILLIVFLGVMCVMTPAKEKVTPQSKAAADIEKCYATKECANPMNIAVSHEWFLQAPQNKAYGVYSFTFTKLPESDKPKEKKEKKEGAANLPLTYNLQVRAYSKTNQPKEGKPVFMGFKSAIPEKNSSDDMFTFAFPADPDSYELVLSVLSSDYSQVSSILYETEFPSFASAEKMSSSTPFFFKKIEKIEQADTVFTVWKNSFHYGVGEVFPYFENKFKAEEQPNLFLQFIGITPDAATSAYDLECAFVIKQADELVVRFRPMSVSSPGLVQPVTFVKEGKPLESGDYTLHILVEDKISGMSLSRKLDFSIL